MEGKSIFTSKTFWTNLVALVAMVIQGLTGKQFLSLEIQGTILAVVNILLRTITKAPVNWQ
tara:strand:+ start:439 stop:621 length:183 start_codon:yes stop_codon:yes gene_type:complete